MQPGADLMNIGSKPRKCPLRDIGSLITADSVSLCNRDYTSRFTWKGFPPSLKLADARFRSQIF